MEIYQNSALSPKERAADLVSKMTLQEKVGQLNQKLYGFSAYTRKGDAVELAPSFTEEVEKWGGLGTLYGLFRADPWSQRDFETGLTGKVAIRAYNLAQKYVVEHSRFGIPMLVSTECPHGHQALDGYLLPTNLAMGAAWSPKHVEEGFQVVGKQIAEMGNDFALMSMLDVARDPRWGRNEECYSEDPYLCAQNAAAAVRGCRSEGLEVVAKHFCAQGETTGGVNASAARIGERELREIHFPPMAAAAKAGATGVMAAYNEIDGIPCHANPWLLRDVLRGEMGFHGVVMADGGAIDRIGVLTGDNLPANGAVALKAGVDISLWDRGFTCLAEAVEQGLVSEALLDEAVQRVLEIKFARGLFEHPYLDEKELTDFNDAERFPQSLELARQSVVLLKNEAVLPIDPNTTKKIAVIGPNADALYQMLGDYTASMQEEKYTTVLSGLQKALPNATVRFAAGCTICDADRTQIDAAVKLAAESDLVILALGGSSSRFSGAEFADNGAAIVGAKLQMDCGEGVDAASLELPGAQNPLAEAVFATGVPVVTVMVSGRAYAVKQVAEKSAALLWSFYPGPWGGQAIAEVITGQQEPAGCLPVSIPRSTGQIPVYYNYRKSYDATRYWDETFGPLYSFGYGMHYTTMQLADADAPETIRKSALCSGATVPVTCTVENTGSRPGYAVVQLYIEGLSGSIVRRVKELKGFTKVYLQPGEKQQVTLQLNQESLSVFSARNRVEVEPGCVRLMLEESGTPAWNTTLHITEA